MAGWNRAEVPGEESREHRIGRVGMRLAVVTINFNDVLCENARRSFQAAADRWGASCVELTPQNSPPNLTPFLLKMRIFECSDADRIFYVDGADAVIRGDAPCPFDLCPPNCLGAVKNAYCRFPNYLQIVQQENSEWSVMNRILGEHLPKADSFFNAGVMVLTRSSHQELFDQAYQYHDQLHGRVAWLDQTFLNYAAAKMRKPVLLMDETWNYVHPEYVGHWDYMEHYVYHFAGSPERSAVIPRLRWRMPLSNWCQKRFPDRPKLARMAGWCETRFRWPSASRLLMHPVQRKDFLKKIPVLGPLLRYAYWWLTLPSRVNRTKDRMEEVSLQLGRLEASVEALQWKFDQMEKRAAEQSEITDRNSS